MAGSVCKEADADLSVSSREEVVEDEKSGLRHVSAEQWVPLDSGTDKLAHEDRSLDEGCGKTGVGAFRRLRLGRLCGAVGEGIPRSNRGRA